MHQVHHRHPAQGCVGFAEAGAEAGCLFSVLLQWRKFSRCRFAEAHDRRWMPLKPKAVIANGVVHRTMDVSVSMHLHRARGQMPLHLNAAFASSWLWDALFDSMGVLLDVQVPSESWLDVDLLHRRREEAGLRRQEPVAVQVLKRRGILLGAIGPGLTLLCSGFLWFQQQQLQHRAKALMPSADEHEILLASIEATEVSIKDLEEANQTVATALADVRSTSAVLAELRQRVPHSMRLTKLAIEGDALIIDGEALQPNGLRSINAFMLSLVESRLFPTSAVELIEVKLGEQAIGANAAASAMVFSLKAGFTQNAAQLLHRRLDALGSEGLALRLARLRQEGLLP